MGDAALIKKLGIKPGDRVATLTGNSPEHVAALFACRLLRGAPQTSATLGLVRNRTRTSEK